MLKVLAISCVMGSCSSPCPPVNCSDGALISISDPIAITEDTTLSIDVGNGPMACQVLTTLEVRGCDIALTLIGDDAGRLGQVLVATRSERLSLQVDVDGERVLDGMVSLEYSTTYPHGPDCGGCVSAGGSI